MLLEHQEHPIHEPDLLENNSQVWFAGKEIKRGCLLSEFVGKNEKTKIIVRLQKHGSGPSVREAPIDEETQKAMMAFAHKKREQDKKLRDDDETDD